MNHPTLDRLGVTVSKASPATVSRDALLTQLLLFSESLPDLFLNEACRIASTKRNGCVSYLAEDAEKIATKLMRFF